MVVLVTTRDRPARDRKWGSAFCYLPVTATRDNQGRACDPTPASINTPTQSAVVGAPLVPSLSLLGTYTAHAMVDDSDT
jgi:hypothetical protein